jgi:DNA-binding NarL/FixJ family response regulator
MIRIAMDAPALRNLAEQQGFELVSDPGDAEILVAQVEGEELPPRWTNGEQQMPPLIVLATRAPVDEWLRAGVRGILPPDVDAAELAVAVQAVHAGLTVIHPDLLQRDEEQEKVATSLLTPREIEVLRRVAEGLPNKIIAYEMSISEHTVKFHIAQILSKLQAGSRTEAVTAGLRLGIVHL